MKIEKNYKIITTVDTFVVNNFLRSIIKEHWADDISRQQTFDVHKHTETIFLRFRSNVSDCGIAGLKFINYPLFEYYEEHILKILDIIKNYYKINDYCAILANLKPLGNIPLHTDNGPYFNSSHRVHLPLLTNSQVNFYIGNEIINMKAGTLYEINNVDCLHGVDNLSNCNRYHLILDLF